MSNECVDNYFLTSWFSGKRCKPDDNQTRIKVDSLTKQIIASGIGSITTILTLNPLNVLKIRLQNSHISMEKVDVKNLAMGIARKEGWKGFWSGTAISLTMSLPNTILFMTAYERCKVMLRDSFPSSSSNSGTVSRSIVNDDDNSMNNVDSWWIPALAGGFARGFSVTIISPLELARTIKAAGNKGSTVQIMRDVVQTDGVKGLYRGWIPTLWRDCPFSALYWFNVELWKPIFYNLLSSSSTAELENSSIDSNQSWRTSASVFLAGSTGSFISAVITHPFDVMKTQKQLTSSVIGTDSILLQRKGSVGLIVDTVRVEGFYGIFRGLSMRLLTVIPGSAILVTVYEAIKAIDF